MEIPGCPNHIKFRTCERSDPVVLTEQGGTDYYMFGCRTCRATYVVTAPRGVERARWENELKRQSQLAMTQKDRKVFGAYYQGASQ